jgi:hypothetical protein
VDLGPGRSSSRVARWNRRVLFENLAVVVKELSVLGLLAEGFLLEFGQMELQILLGLFLSCLVVVWDVGDHSSKGGSLGRLAPLGRTGRDVGRTYPDVALFIFEILLRAWSLGNVLVGCLRNFLCDCFRRHEVFFVTSSQEAVLHSTATQSIKTSLHVGVSLRDIRGLAEQLLVSVALLCSGCEEVPWLSLDFAFLVQLPCFLLVGGVIANSVGEGLGEEAKSLSGVRQPT